MFSLELPHRGDSNEYTQYTIFNLNTKNHPKLFQICSYEIYAKGLKNEFDSAVVNESTVFEPLKFYCNFKYWRIYILAFNVLTPNIAKIILPPNKNLLHISLFVYALCSHNNLC